MYLGCNVITHLSTEDSCKNTSVSNVFRTNFSLLLPCAILLLFLFSISTFASMIVELELESSIYKKSKNKGSLSFLKRWSFTVIVKENFYNRNSKMKSQCLFGLVYIVTPLTKLLYSGWTLFKLYKLSIKIIKILYIGLNNFPFSKVYLFITS